LELFASIGQSQEVWLSLIAEEINEEGDASHACVGERKKCEKSLVYLRRPFGHLKCREKLGVFRDLGL
jgi:hypothetical protein